jgi:hypothetical protein
MPYKEEEEEEEEKEEEEETRRKWSTAWASTESHHGRRKWLKGKPWEAHVTWFHLRPLSHMAQVKSSQCVSPVPQVKWRPLAAARVRGVCLECT